MDPYIPKRRVAVTLWTDDGTGHAGQVFLDLDPAGSQHQTVLERLNEASRFLPVACGPEGSVQLFHKGRLARVTVGPGVLQSDAFTRGFSPWREEEAEVWLADGSSVSGRVWMPLERPNERMSDFMNRCRWEFFVLLAGSGVQLVNAGRVVRMALTECAGAPLDSPDSRIVHAPDWSHLGFDPRGLPMVNLFPA
jgi:hypothetical protein